MNIQTKVNDFSAQTLKVPTEYIDIIHAEIPRNINRPKMSMEQRAAQFAPFAALTGFDEIILDISKKEVVSSHGG